MNRPGAGLGVGPRPRLTAWIHHHRQSAADSLKKILNTPMSTILTWLVAGIALALPTILFLLLENASAITGDLELPARFSLLLKPDTRVDAAESLARKLEVRVDVERVELVTRDEALASFVEDTGLGGLANTLVKNPLPHTLLVSFVKVLPEDRVIAQAEAFAKQELVDELVFDTRWQSRFEASLEFGRRLTFGLGLLMVVGMVLILGNTVRLAVEARREEIVVIKLIGGGDGFTRRPFLYTGLWFGIGGGLFGALLVTLFFAFIVVPVESLLQLYDSHHKFSGLGVVGVLNLIQIGGLLGLISAWQAVSFHLKQL